jgi:hypothetical protein
MKDTGKERQTVMITEWTNQRKGKGMQKKVGKTKMSITLIYIMTQYIQNSDFTITSNYSFFPANNGQAVTLPLAVPGV